MGFFWEFGKKEEAPKKASDTKQKKENYHFQVNLGGMLDVLSNHLYKSPDVFLRELLQNGVDAITLRKKKQPEWENGRISISLDPGQRMRFRDNGAGLTEEEIHRFLAVIGQSSKAGLTDGELPQDYIGRFGIGLLSCFMVSDSIIIHTKSVDSEKAYVWKGLPDGTYTLRQVEMSMTGTVVTLNAKPGAEHYFQPEKVAELVQYYGLALPVPVYLKGSKERINNIPSDFLGMGRSQLLAFGEWLFGEEFLEAIPIQTKHLSGVAYVLPYRTDASVKGGHRIYLKQMLLTEEGHTLLPSWSFFLRCFLNTRDLRPTASREDFYHDKELELARKEFEEAVRSYLEDLARYEPNNRLQTIVNTHVQAIKALSVWNYSLFCLFIDYLPFQTSEGEMTGAALKQAGEAVWVENVSKFKQLRPIFMAQGRLLVCTGYTYDTELVAKMARIFSLPLEPLKEEGMDLVLEHLQEWEAENCVELLHAASRALDEFDCQGEVRRFLPADLPVLYAMSDDVQFLRQVQSAKETSQGIFSDALSSLLESVNQRPLSSLYLNMNNPLIQRLMVLGNDALLESSIRVLYVQALLAGGHPLRGDELKTMSHELLNLIDQKR